MKRVFLVSDEEEFSDWIKEELKDYARVIRVIDNNDFFIQQWETSDAEIAIVLYSAIQSVESFTKAYMQITAKNSNVPFVFIHSSEGDESEDYHSLKELGMIWIEWHELDIGLIEKRLEAFFSIKELQSGITVVHSIQTVEDKQNHETGIEVSEQKEIVNEVSSQELHSKDLVTTDSLTQVELQDQQEFNIEIIENDGEIEEQLKNEALDEFMEFTDDTSSALEKENKSETLEENIEGPILKDEFFSPRSQKSRSKLNRPKLPSLPKHDEVKERIIITERIVGTVIIAIAGTCRGSGSTHNAIQISNFLRNDGYDVACVEMLDPDMGPPSFKFLGDGDGRQTKVEKGFHVNGIDFYKEVDSDQYVQIIQAQYQYVVIDLGQIITYVYEKPSEGKFFQEFLRSHLAILCTRPAVWDFPYLIPSIDKLLSHSWSKQINILINFTDAKRFDYFCSRFEPKVRKALQLKFHHNSFTPDPFEKDENSILSNLLNEVLPKIRKENRLFSFFKFNN
ncbi:hypothetical protein JI735_33885 (plasmid) [Paenibacillus sonchi]|uniref:Uncharacterized protein n=1 Tax=Paenibacillus sonchi TaxID=373687 RepID=A0A974PJI8_9BACL|nr:hypothetical protein [Paenibacillus sonchi]QQZ64641.1 hypothetical protein JI735_33885 [Paenibacillus sonchi]